MSQAASIKAPEQVPAWADSAENLSVEKILHWAVAEFAQGLTFASALGLEDQILTHVIASSKLAIRSFTLDTGRLFPETYDLIEATTRRYGQQLEVFFPQQQDVETMVHEHGINLFYESVENRKLCCAVRKLRPLKRALAGAQAWICGLRGGQSLSRQPTRAVEWDQLHGLVKINPLWNWSEEQIWQFIHAHQVPYNKLHDRGFPSIGCASCTRAVQGGDDPRSGRWWWEESNKECGLHLRNEPNKNEPNKETR